MLCDLILRSWHLLLPWGFCGRYRETDIDEQEARGTGVERSKKKWEQPWPRSMDKVSWYQYEQHFIVKSVWWDWCWWLVLVSWSHVYSKKYSKIPTFMWPPWVFWCFIVTLPWHPTGWDMAWWWSMGCLADYLCGRRQLRGSFGCVWVEFFLVKKQPSFGDYTDIPSSNRDKCRYWILISFDSGCDYLSESWILEQRYGYDFF